MKNSSKTDYYALLLVFAVPMILIWKLDITSDPVRTWWLLIVTLLAFLAITGHSITGCWRGALIDSRNVISLSRFQMAAWTVLVLSAFMTAALYNILQSKMPTPIDIRLPDALWLLMGISTASLTGSPLILDGKKNQIPNDQEMRTTFKLLEDQQGNVNTSHQGQIVINTSIDEACWTDLFTGEETGNAAHLDLSRIQMFFFTIISILTYGVAIGHILGGAHVTDGITEFPELSEGLVALIGISHTGYLAAKALPQSQTGISPSPEEAAIDDIDGCCADHNAAHTTSDEDLPAAEGGVL